MNNKNKDEHFQCFVNFKRYLRNLQVFPFPWKRQKFCVPVFHAQNRNRSLTSGKWYIRQMVNPKAPAYVPTIHYTSSVCDFVTSVQCAFTNQNHHYFFSLFLSIDWQWTNTYSSFYLYNWGPVIFSKCLNHYIVRRLIHSFPTGGSSKVVPRTFNIKK